MQQQIQSSAQAVEATAQVWRGMVDLVKDCKIEHGRGCVYYEKNSDTLGYISLFDLQQNSAEDLELDPDIRRQLLALVGGKYDFHTEFILLVKHEHDSEIRYVLQIGALDYEGWREVKSPEEIKAQERESQLTQARMLKAMFEQKRKKKKKR